MVWDLHSVIKQLTWRLFSWDSKLATHEKMCCCLLLYSIAVFPKKYLEIIHFIYIKCEIWNKLSCNKVHKTNLQHIEKCCWKRFGLDSDRLSLSVFLCRSAAKCVKWTEVLSLLFFDSDSYLRLLANIYKRNWKIAMETQLTKAKFTIFQVLCYKL